MKSMNNRASHLFILLLAIYLLTGCQKQTSEPVHSPKSVKSSSESDRSPLKKHKETHSNESKSKKNDFEISSPSAGSPSDPEENSAKQAQENQEPDKDTPVKKEPKKTDYNVTEPYNAGKPTLMGLTVNDPRDKVIERFGNPENHYTMQDETDPITVFEYPDFSVGFSSSNTVQFIEVNSDRINPGLNGLRLGQKVDDAIKAIGKPDTNTDYVLGYRSSGVILKLDTDPKTNVIHSIKLFADNAG